MSLENEFANLTAAVVRLASGVENLLALSQNGVAQGAPVETAVGTSTQAPPPATTAPPASPKGNGAAEPAADAPTLADCKAAAKAMAAAFNQAEGRQATIDVLARFGATKMPEVKPEQYGDFIALCQEVQAGSAP